MNQYCQDILETYIQICIIDVYYLASRSFPHSQRKYVEKIYYKISVLYQ